ncbi:MAG: hypothetical protein N2446_03070 [Elusimicrobiales bacterium]|nr:hypothetical protein [Elusimicrobiales bacterium]
MNLFIVFLVIFNIKFWSEVYKVDSFVFDFESGWNSTKGSDPNSSLKIEKGSSYAEFIKLEDELSDFYIKSRLEEQRQQIEAKALKPSSVKVTNIHTKSKAYYFTYRDKKESTIALFSYDGLTYSFVSSGIDEDSFKKMIFTFRKEGESIEIAKPQPKPKKNISKPKPIEDTNLQYVLISEKVLSTSSLDSSTYSFISTNQISSDTETIKFEDINKSSEVIELEKVESEKQVVEKTFLQNLSEYFKSHRQNVKLVIERKPLSPYFSLILIFLYIVASLFFKFKFSKYTNLKIKPYPKELPADFLFPFIITRVKTSKETIYQIITRTGQFLSASITYPYHSIYSSSLILLIFFHLAWSFISLFDSNIFYYIFLSIPFGNYILSFVEIPFLLVYVWCYIVKKRTPLKLILKDPQMNEIAQVVNNENESFIVKDAKGKDAIKIKRVGFWKRKYIFFDEDNTKFMEIKDEYPIIWIVTKILGNYILKKRCYYSIRNEKGDLVGFLYLDSNNYDSYQIHFDFDYMRLVNSTQLVAAMLYIISVDKEKHILTL